MFLLYLVAVEFPGVCRVKSGHFASEGYLGRGFTKTACLQRCLSKHKPTGCSYEHKNGVCWYHFSRDVMRGGDHRGWICMKLAAYWCFYISKYDRCNNLHCTFYIRTINFHLRIVVLNFRCKTSLDCSWFFRNCKEILRDVSRRCYFQIIFDMQSRQLT